MRGWNRFPGCWGPSRWEDEGLNHVMMGLSGMPSQFLLAQNSVSQSDLASPLIGWSYSNFPFNTDLGLLQELANCFYKGPGSTYSRLADHLVSMETTQLCCCRAKASCMNNTQTNGHGCVLIQRYLPTLKFEFHLIPTSWNIIFLKICFQSFKTMKKQSWLIVQP